MLGVVKVKIVKEDNEGKKKVDRMEWTKKTVKIIMKVCYRKDFEKCKLDFLDVIVLSSC